MIFFSSFYLFGAQAHPSVSRATTLSFALIKVLGSIVHPEGFTQIKTSGKLLCFFSLSSSFGFTLIFFSSFYLFGAQAHPSVSRATTLSFALIKVLGSIVHPEGFTQIKTSGKLLCFFFL